MQSEQWSEQGTNYCLTRRLIVHAVQFDQQCPQWIGVMIQSCHRSKPIRIFRIQNNLTKFTPVRRLVRTNKPL